MKQQVTDLFKSTYGGEPAFIARAPGRIEFIGNHTDYNGGPVLGAAIDRSVWVAVRPIEGSKARLMSPLRVGVVEVDLSLISRRSGAHSWVNYPMGVFLQLQARKAAPLGGFEFAACSDLPSGSGMSSSAALELASAFALTALSGASLPKKEMAVLAQMAENIHVGVPCGILDQGVSAFGKRNHLVHIDCAALAFETVSMPAGTRFWIFNTHKKHTLVDSLYATRHAECRAAFDALRSRNPELSCLADATLEELDAAAPKMDPVLVKRARHVIEECLRVNRVVISLSKGNLADVGAALTASHRSSQHLFENSVPELDCLVDILEKAPHVHGARLTGGGFGGAVMAFTDASFSESDAEAVAAVYEKRFGARPDILPCETGDGAGIVS